MIKEIASGIFAIENYISKETCKFLSSCFDSQITETSRKAIYAGPSFSKNNPSEGLSDGQNYFKSDLDHTEYQVGLDILAGLADRTAKTISHHYNKDYYLKSMFWSRMLSGAKNTIHMDNWYETPDSLLKPRPFNKHDRSGLLYLNDKFEGGELRFIKNNFKIKPTPGTFIFFEGNLDSAHEVLEVISGVRNNIISFYGDNEFYTLDTNIKIDDQEISIQEVQSTEDSLKAIKQIIEDYDQYNL